jgi:hypothetical protein
VSQISIAYTVPVQVVVDLDTRQVTRVVVIDEEVAAQPDGYREQYGTGRACSDEQARQGYAIAEQDTWPSWDFGW